MKSCSPIKSFNDKWVGNFIDRFAPVRRKQQKVLSVILYTIYAITPNGEDKSVPEKPRAHLPPDIFSHYVNLEIFFYTTN